MTDTSRIEDLRRRVREDPASIAFAQLAEECRRAGYHEEAVELCRAGLTKHPGYLSARVTLGRALAHLGLIDDARLEFRTVLGHAPENLAALRGLAEIYYHQGAFSDAMVQYTTALTLAPNDPELERSILDVSQALARTTDRRDQRRGEQTLTVLEQWLAAIHVTRTERRA